MKAMESGSVIQELIQCLKANSWTVGFAESCTGGLLSAALVREPGVSAVYKGSVVSYANSVKEELLGVNPQSLREEGAVSESVALQMAQGLRQRLQVDWAVAITGIAGPSGGTAEKPVGTVCFGFVGPELEKLVGAQGAVSMSGLHSEALRIQFAGDRVKIQTDSAEYALEHLLKMIQDGLGK